MGNFNLLPPDQPDGTAAPLQLQVPTRAVREPARPRTVFDRILDEDRAAQEAQLRRSIEVSLDSDPEFVAEAQRIGIEINADPLAIEENIEGYRRIKQRLDLERWNRSAFSPILRWQMQSPRFARVAKDDLINLGALEQLGRGWDLAGVTRDLGQLYTQRQFSGLSEAETNEVTRLETRLKEDETLRDPGGLLFPFAQIAGIWLQAVPSSIAVGFGTGAGFAGVAAALPTSALPFGVAVVPSAAFLAGGTVGAATEFFRQIFTLEAGHLFNDLREAGVDDTTATIVGTLGGLTMTGLETLGVGLTARAARPAIDAGRRAIIRRLGLATAEALKRPTTGGALGNALKGYAAALVGEPATEVGQDFVSLVSTDIGRGLSGIPLELTTAEGFDAAVDQLADTLAFTARGMVLMGALGSGAGLVADSQRVRQTKQDVASFEKRVGIDEASEVRRRNPDRYEEFADQTTAGTRIDEAYIEASKFQAALAQTGFSREELAKAMPEVDAQLDAAVASGGDVVMKTSRYSRLIRTKLEPALRPHVRFAQEGEADTSYSAAEEPEVQAHMKAIRENIVKEAEEVESFAQEAREVEEQVLREIKATARVGDQEAVSSAAAFREMVSVLAAENGKTPKAMLEELRGLEVQRGEEPTVTPEALAQRTPEEFKEELRRRIAKRKEREGPGSPKALAQLQFDIDQILSDYWRGALAVSEVRIRADKDLARLVERFNETSDTKLTFEGLTEKAKRLHAAEQAKEDLEQRLSDENFLRKAEGLPPLTPEETRQRDPNILRQDQGATRGEFVIDDSGKGIIRLLPGSDVTTVLHEMSHAYLHWLGKLAARPNASKLVTEQMDRFLAWRGIEGGSSTWNAMSFEEQKPHHEAFAESFEVYAFEGQAPSIELRDVFRSFRRWITRIWRNLRGKVREIDPEVRAIFDRMLASEDAIRHAQAVRGLEPLFQEKPEGMTDAEWIDHVRREDVQFEEIVEEMTRRGLRDMQWLRNARGKRLREMQREHDKLYAEIEAEVLEELEVEPVYRALAFLRTGRLVDANGIVQPWEGQAKLHTDSVREILGLKAPKRPKLIRDMELSDAIVKLGGLSREQALEMGVDPGEINTRRGILPIFPKRGRRLDDLREALEQVGFRFDDEAALADAVLTSLRGEEVFAEVRELSGAELSAEAEADAVRRGEEVPTVNLVKLRVTSPKGMAPDVVAPMVGFSAGEELVRALAGHTPLDEAVASVAEERMQAEHGELVDAAQIQKAVDEALLNPARGRFLAAEERALTRSGQPVRLMVAAARNVARETLEGMAVAQIKPWRFQAAESRHAREAVRARIRGDMPAAIVAKRNERLQHEMAREAAKIEKEVARAEKLFRRFRQTDKKIAEGKGKRDIDLVIGGRALLRSVQAHPPTQTPQEVEQQKAALALLARDFAPVHLGIEGLRAEMGERAGRGEKVHYRQLPLEMFRSVVDTTSAVWELARSSRLLVIEGRKIQLADAVVGLQETIQAQRARLAPKSKPPGNISPSKPARGIRRVWHWLASAKRFQHWAQFMDQDKADGAFTELMMRPMFALLDVYRVQRNAIFGRLDERLQKLTKQYGGRWDANIATNLPSDDGTGYVFRGVRQLLDVLLDIGNESNKTKRLVSEGWAPDPTTTDGILDTSRWDEFFQGQLQTETNPNGLITPELMEFVADIWSEFEALRPQAQEAHKAIFGFEFKELELQEVSLPWLDTPLRGGYAPLRMDWDRVDDKRQQIQVAETASGMEHSFQYSNAAIGAGRGFTMERNPNYFAKLSMDIGRRIQAFDEELRFIHLQPHIKTVLRITRDRDFRATMNAYDPEAITAIIEPWLDATGRQTLAEPTRLPIIDAIARWMKNATGIGILGLDLTVAMVQLTGISLAKTQVERKYLRAAMRQFTSNPRQAWRDAADKSVRMEERLNDHTDRIRDRLSRQSFNKPLARNLKAFQDEAGRFAWAPIRFMQGSVDIITWHAAYQQSIVNASTDLDMDTIEKRAVQDADQAVERSQGGTNPESRAAFETSTPAMQLMFQFMTFSNVLLNQTLVQGGLSQTRAGQLGNYLLLPFTISVYETVLRVLLEGLPEDDDDDGYMDELAAKLLSNTARNVVGMVPIAGPSVAALLTGEADRVATAPAVEAGKQAVRGLLSFVDDREGIDVRATGTLLTFVFGLPIRPVAEHLDFLLDLSSGEVQPTSTLDLIRGLATARASEGSRR